MINVTKTFLPPFEEYVNTLKRAWDLAWITNNGILVQELEQKLKSYLGTDNLLFTANGTVVLQMALKALNITKEVITTPFSYVATTNAILWEGATPVFVDIDPNTFCIDPQKIEAAITQNTQAILATHVYGIPCDIEKIQTIAERFGLKVIYDAAHAFGCSINGKSLLSFGDISTCSFHATKVFHSVEGGCIVSDSEEMNTQLSLLRSFGHIGDEHYCAGINGKNSEFHAAMGLVNLNYITQIISERKNLSQLYDSFLTSENLLRPTIPVNMEYNYAYYPVVVETEDVLHKIVDNLRAKGVSPRRYFYPSLNEIPQTKYLNSICPVSETTSRRVLSLPLYAGLEIHEAEMIAGTIKKVLRG
ncbi:MAG: DegT/DnrJ/EryC1/StrS family aminotransferase [Bacteroidetes bacterium]|nr:DegT/DnrJ/EryC1/StrS family aminotransferase [Bacteroidota bacterium]